jgi:hypothetical protein
MGEETHSSDTCCRPVVLKAPGWIVLIPKDENDSLSGHSDPQSGAPVKLRVPDVTVHVQPPQLCNRGCQESDVKEHGGVAGEHSPYMRRGCGFTPPKGLHSSANKALSWSIPARNFSYFLMTEPLPGIQSSLHTQGLRAHATRKIVSLFYGFAHRVFGISMRRRKEHCSKEYDNVSLTRQTRWGALQRDAPRHRLLSQGLPSFKKRRQF